MRRASGPSFRLNEPLLCERARRGAIRTSAPPKLTIQPEPCKALAGEFARLHTWARSNSVCARGQLTVCRRHSLLGRDWLALHHLGGRDHPRDHMRYLVPSRRRRRQFSAQTEAPEWLPFARPSVGSGQGGILTSRLNICRQSAPQAAGRTDRRADERMDKRTSCHAARRPASEKISPIICITMLLFFRPARLDRWALETQQLLVRRPAHCLSAVDSKSAFLERKSQAIAKHAAMPLDT